MRVTTFLCLLVIGGLSTTCSRKEEPRPNILWILAEDLSPDLGCYGYPLVRTPIIDQLASEGMRFNNVFTTAPVCTPSRTALATGMYQTSINAHHMRYPDSLKNELPDGVLPLNEIFRRNGYQTVNVKSETGTGKTDWSFKSELSVYDHNSWEEIDPDQPFFAVVNLRLTHRPFEKDEQHPVDPGKVTLPPYYPDHTVARQDWADYLETVQLMDGQVGEILDELKERGWDENTIVYFFSDHGRPFTRGKMFLYDSGIKIPLIIKSPKSLKWQDHLPGGSVNDQLLSSLDIVATSLSMAGIEKPETMQGRVFLGEHAEAARDYIFSAADRIGEIYLKSRSVRSDAFKYIRNYRHDFSVNEASTAYRRANHPIYQLLDILNEKNALNEIQENIVTPLPEEELYDLQSDPYETLNLTGNPEFQEILISLQGQLKEWQQQTTDHGMREDSEALASSFVEYGKTSAKSNRAKAEKLRNKVMNQIEKNL